MMTKGERNTLIAMIIGLLLNWSGLFHMPGEVETGVTLVVTVFLCISVGLLILAYAFDGMAKLKARLRGVFGKRAV
ncbi:hypothetical protein [Methylocaldum gracile]|jgi:hypothetical protein|uniref:hypothetical protein n=1 Tax=Methylocaldum sp. 0917 TaxID=2485163 RepID=UPI00105BC422